MNDTPMRKIFHRWIGSAAVCLALTGAAAADTAVVKVSAVWTPAEAAAGGTPMLMSKVLEIWP